MALRRIRHWADWLSVVLVIWAVLAILPASVFWFDPGDVIVANSDTSHPPVIEFTRTIKRDTNIEYTAIVRNLETRETLCDPKGGPFTYRRDASLPAVIDLVWWTGGDDRCWPQGPGEYILETCWTVVQPVFGIVPPKTVCRKSNPFTIAAVAQGEARQAIDAQQSIQRQIEDLERQIETLRSSR